MEAEDEKEECE